jgi:hypothetical protein
VEGEKRRGGEGRQLGRDWGVDTLYSSYCQRVILKHWSIEQSSPMSPQQKEIWCSVKGTQCWCTGPRTMAGGMVQVAGRTQDGFQDLMWK